MVKGGERGVAEARQVSDAQRCPCSEGRRARVPNVLLGKAITIQGFLNQGP